MLYDISDYEFVKSNRQSKWGDFEVDSNVGRMARTFLVSASNLELIKEHVETTEDLALRLQDRHKFQHNLAHLTVHTSYSIFDSIKRGTINSGYRDLRYLMDIFFTITALNDEFEKAAEEYNKMIQQTNAIVGDPSEMVKFNFDYIEYLGRRRDSGYDDFVNNYPEIKRVYDYNNERAAHPLRLDGSYLEGEHRPYEAYQQSYVTLSFLYMIVEEYANTLIDMGIYSELKDEFDDLRLQIRAGYPGHEPAYLSEYLD